MEMTSHSHGNSFLDCLVRDVIIYYNSLDSDDGVVPGDADSATAGTVVVNADNERTAAAIATALETAEAPPPDDDCCAICLHDDDDEEEEMAEPAQWKRIATCGHRFHGVCVERWLRVKPSCPVCRRPAAVATTTVEEIMEIYGDYSDSFESSLRLQAIYGWEFGDAGCRPSIIIRLRNNAKEQSEEEL